MDNGYVDPAWDTPRHICFNAFWRCPVCDEDAVVDLWDKSTWVCPYCE